jgi:hypothetical protein
VRPLARALAIARAAGIPARCVAEEAGISPALLSMVASGTVPATEATREGLARALGCSEKDLFPDA